MTTQSTHFATIKAEILISDDICHPAFGMPNWLSKAEYNALTDTQKSYYVINK